MQDIRVHDACTALKTIPLCGAIKNSPVIPLSVLTHSVMDAFQSFLRLHPDRIFVTNLLSILTLGADIGYRGPQLSRIGPNSLSARIHADILKQQISTGLALFHAVGLFSSPPQEKFVVSSLGVCPKKTGNFRSFWI